MKDHLAQTVEKAEASTNDAVIPLGEMKAQVDDIVIDYQAEEKTKKD